MTSSPPSPRTTRFLGAAIAAVLVAGLVAAAGTSTESAGAAATASTLGTITDQTVVYKIQLAGTLHRDGRSTLVYGVRPTAAQPAAAQAATGGGRGGAATNGAGSAAQAASAATQGATATANANAVQKSILTALADPGQVISQGQQLWTVDAKPTVLFYGTTAAYRVMALGVSDGNDVQQLEANLTALGFTDGGALTVDAHFDAATAEAVKEWQTALGVDATGSVSPIDIVFAPGARRVLGANSVTGDAVTPGTELLTVSGTDTIATIEAPVQGPGSLQVGDHVDLDLGGRAQTGGTVRTVSRDVTRAGATAPAQVAVDIAPDDQAAAANLVDGTVVTATVVVARGTGGPAVPVSALHEGPAGLTRMTLVDKTGARREVDVVPGVAGDGLVQITGPGLAVGDRIVLG